MERNWQSLGQVNVRWKVTLRLFNLNLGMQINTIKKKPYIIMKFSKKAHLCNNFL